MHEHLELIYATGTPERVTIAMTRYKEDVEQFMMNFSEGAAS